MADPNLTQKILDLVQKAASCKELKKGANEGTVRHRYIFLYKIDLSERIVSYVYIMIFACKCLEILHCLNLQRWVLVKVPLAQAHRAAHRVWQIGALLMGGCRVILLKAWP